MHEIVIQLYRMCSRDVELPNPHKRGLKKVFREIFPLTEAKPYTKAVKFVSFSDIKEIFTEDSKVAEGKKYLKTSETEPYDAGEGWTSFRHLYILEDDFNNIIRGDYYPYIKVKEPETTNEN